MTSTPRRASSSFNSMYSAALSANSYGTGVSTPPHALLPHHHGMNLIHSDPILTSLRIPPGLRRAEELQPICEFVKGLKFFHSFTFYPETVAQIAARLELHTFLNGSHIFHEGEVGNHFYVILDGEVSIYKRKRVQSMDSVLENVLLVKLGSGQHFGETALESKDGLRTASAIATKNSNLLMLHRDDYLTILSHFKSILKTSVRKTLSMPSSIFNHLPETVIDSLSEVAVIRSFPPNSIIYVSGTRVSSLMIVKSGLVKLIKPITRTDYEEAKREIETKIKIQKRTVSARSPLHNRLPRSPKTGLLAPTSPEEPSPKSIGTRRPFSNGRSLSLVDHRSETPPGHWILTRSEDYVAKSKLGSSFRDNITESSIMPMIGSYGRLSFSGNGNASIVSHVQAALQNVANNRSGSPVKSSNAARVASNDQVEFTVGVLMSGDVLGEVCILDFENITPLTAIASTSVELYCIDVEVLIELGIPRDEKIMRSLLDDWKFRNPPASEIRKKFQVKYEWEARKKQILHEMKQDKKNSKKKS